MENTVNYEADFVFIEGGHDLYIIHKDRYGWLDLCIAVDRGFVDSFLKSEYKTTILNSRGEIMMQNFKDVNMKVVQDLLSSAEKSYEERVELLAEIDNALDSGDKVLFLKLTEQLKQLDGGITSEHGVA